MSALVRKEIRLILPAWSVAMVLAILPVWIVWPGPHGLLVDSPGFLVYAPFGIGVLLLGLTPFGQELNFGTFSMLLAQPTSRQHLWGVKTRILAAALGLVFVAALVSTLVRTDFVIETLKTTDWRKLWNHPVTELQMLGVIRDLRGNALHDSLVMGGLCVMTAFAGGLWTNLLFRNTSAAFWFSALIPLGLGLMADKLFVGFLPGDVGLIAALSIYSVVVFFWARKFFLRVQDAQWTGGLLSLPALLGFKTNAAAEAPGRNLRPIRALIRKEVQLHQVNLFIACLLLLTHLVVIVVRRIGADYFLSHRSVGMIWESWPLLWLVMPLLIGGVAVAEERKLGTLENFLCLPTTRWREFGVKLFVAFLLGIALGGIIPLTVEWLGTSMGLSGNIFGMSMTFSWKTVSLIPSLLAGSVGLTLAAVYASTLTRNLLQALGLALVLSLFLFFIIITGVGTSNGEVFGRGETLLWHGRLIGFIGWPVMVGTVIVLAFKNFKQLNPGSTIWLQNLFSILGALVFTVVSTSVIYHRVWEMWIPDEPEHRYWPTLFEAQISAGKTNKIASQRITPKLEASRSRVAVIMPNRSLWLRQRRVVGEKREGNGNSFEFLRSVGPWHSGFVEGSQWREVAVTGRSTFAIRMDGSLWDLSEVEPGNKDGGTKPQRVGDDDNWSKIAGSPGMNHFVGLRADGTLWEWGTAFVSSNKWVLSPRNAQPMEVGNDSDWIAICDSEFTSLAVKSDGSLWKWRQVNTLKTNNSWTSQLISQPKRWIAFADKTTKPATLSFDGNTVTAVAEDGSLWAGGYLTYGIADERTQGRARHEMVRLGSNFHWQEVHCIGPGDLVGIAHRGLWKWDLRQMRWLRGPGESFVFPPTSQSKYLDWVASRPCGNAFFALAGDGKLCFWGNPEDDQYWPYPNPNNLLMPSRIKARTVATLLE